MRTVEIIVYEPDLMFSSRIESAALPAGVTLKFVSDPQAIGQRLIQMTNGGVILNLDAAEGWLGSLEAAVKKSSVKTVGYYSHVNSRLAEEARRIGIGVLTRGAFAARLDEVLKELGSGR